MTMEDKDYLMLMVGGLFAYVAYYLIFVVKRPLVAARKEYREFLERKCPILTDKYRPTIWCFGSRAQTILRAFFKSSPPVSYVRELLSTPDGGVIGLDWVEPDNAIYCDVHKRPTVLILPGLTGSSNESYCRHLALQANNIGARAVVFNNRGNGGTPLLNERTYNATNTEDLGHVLAHIRARYPNSTVTAVGVSFGGLLLTHYLTKCGLDSELSAAMSISAPYNMFESTKSLEGPCDHFLFNKMLTENLKEGINRNIHVFKKGSFNIGNVKKSRSIREFDEYFTANQFGYPTHKEYYEDACTHEKLESIRVPFLCLNAADDVFSPAHAIPIERAKRSSHVCIVVPSHGGHIGFLEGLLPRGPNYMDRVFTQYMDMVFHHTQQLQQLLFINQG